MTNWTLEQQMAIDTEGTNIIVSAGAGSGKTAVLTARVLRKLKGNININELLILTFTKAAAHEMKERIRSEIRKDKSLKDQLDLIDSAYITTFDSFALSILKKYHYIKNISSDIKVADESLIRLEKEKLINEIFDELYNDKQESFIKLISDFCVKDDTEIKEYVLAIYEKLNLQIDKTSFIKDYKDTYMSKSKVQKDIDEYESLLRDKILEVRKAISALEDICDADYLAKVLDVLNPLLNSDEYDSIAQNVDIKLPILPRGSLDEVKLAKEKISDLVKEIRKLCCFTSRDDIYSKILQTYDYITIIFDIINKLDEKIWNFKLKNNLFEFNDIIKMSINIIECNESVKNEIKQSLNEIMIDEYQDTNDLQEYFISLISNDNVYMVGDIKQSIYRFRNANPAIFKNKYDQYTKQINGLKVDLNKNFRSRKNVLDGINLLFDRLMTNTIGGADYKHGHQMVFGNLVYEQNQKNQNYDMEVYNYDFDKKESTFTKEEIEFFSIACDIKEKIEKHFKVIDKETKKMRDANYNDFVILMDRSTSFVLAKRIFEYCKIPLIICKDDIITESYDLLVIRNIIRLIIKSCQQEYDTEYKYLFVSLARSFIFEYSDDEIFTLIGDNSFMDDKIIDKINNIARRIDNISITKLLDLINEQFNLTENYIKIGDINNCLLRLEYLYQTAEMLEDTGYTVYDFNNYLKDITEKKYDIKVASTSSGDGARIMTIHKSKGLEFPVCYFAGLDKTFNMHDIKEKFIFNEKYGLVAPFYQNGIGQTIYMELLKNDYLLDEISEKIRLYYVALTRSKEKLILLLPNSDKRIMDIRKCKSFADFMYYTRDEIATYECKLDVDKLNISRDYNFVKKDNYETKINNPNIHIKVQAINIDQGGIKQERFSKNVHDLISSSDKQNIDYGLKFHEILEMIDFKNPNIDDIDDEFIKVKVSRFLDNFILKDIESALTYKETEFMYEDSGTVYHGIIDLIIERDKWIDIIDYKLKYVDDDAYLGQLRGYRKYIRRIKNKPVNTYLYSIIDENLIKID